MKKIILPIVALFVATSMMASESVLFKLVMTNTSTPAKTDGKTAAELSVYAFFIGGSAEVYNGQSSSANVIYAKSGIGYCRLTSKSGYLHIRLNRAIQQGDVIKYTNGSQDSNKMLITTTSTRGGSINVEPNGEGYAIPAESGLIGATELYFWYGTDVNSTTYIQSLTITTTDPEVVYYDFDGETEGTFAQQEEVVLNNGLRVNSNLESGRSGIIKQSVVGDSLLLNIAGAGINRALKLNVTDPCDIEVWAIGAAEGRSLYISDDASDLDKATLYTTTADNKTSLVRSTYRHDSFADNTDLIISPSAGGWKIVAIRVIYDRIRPAANFSVDPASATLKVGESQKFTFVKDYADAVISRSAGAGSDASWIGRNEEPNVSITITAKEAGAGHTYEMILTQVADAYCRQAVVNVPIEITSGSTPTAIEDVQESAIRSQKVIENGQLVIIREGVKYNIQGQIIR